MAKTISEIVFYIETNVTTTVDSPWEQQVAINFPHPSITLLH